MSTPPRTWHRLPTADAVERLAHSCGTNVEIDPKYDALVTETDAGCYWAPREPVTA